jgi:hypothetical protein
MMHSLRHTLIGALLLTFAVAGTVQAQNYTKPKVRAITGFVRLEQATYAQQIAETLTVLRAAKDEFARQGRR